MLKSPLIFIIAICRIVQSGPGPIRVFVRNDQGGTITVDEANTVGDLMDAANQMWPMDDSCSLRLSFGDVLLEDRDQTLADAGISAEGTVHAIVAASTFQLRFIHFGHEESEFYRTVTLDFNEDIVAQLEGEGLYIRNINAEDSTDGLRLLCQMTGMMFWEGVTLRIISERDTGDLVEVGAEEDSLVQMIHHRRGFFAAKPGKNLKLHVGDKAGLNVLTHLPVGFVAAWDLDNGARRLV